MDSHHEARLVPLWPVCCRPVEERGRLPLVDVLLAVEDGNVVVLPALPEQTPPRPQGRRTSEHEPDLCPIRAGGGPFGCDIVLAQKAPAVGVVLGGG